MAKRHSAAETSTKNRNNVPLTPEVNVLVNAACDRWRVKKTDFVRRLVEFFADAPESVQQLMVLGPPRDLQASFIESATEYLAAIARVTESSPPPPGFPKRNSGQRK